MQRCQERDNHGFSRWTFPHEMNCWSCAGGFLIINPSTDAEEHGDVVHFLYKDQIRHLQTRGLWPAAFQTNRESTSQPPAEELRGPNNQRSTVDSDYDSEDDDNDDDLVPNPNHAGGRGDDSSEDEEGDEDEGDGRGGDEGEQEGVGDVGASSSTGVQQDDAVLEKSYAGSLAGHS